MKTLFASLLLSATALHADDGWVDVFNGRDLTNWVNVNGAPETWGVKDGVITCTGKPVGALRLPKMYENFEFELEWRHLEKGGNAGIFVWASPEPAQGQPFLRAIEVQVLDNGYDAKGKNEWYTTHGDVFPIHGATMKPIHKGNGQRCFPLEERSKSSPEWNHYRIVAKDGAIRLSVNGKEVSGGDDCVWRKGYLGLESEGAPTEWRNLRLRELPGSNATAEQTAHAESGWKALYNGVDFRGWTVPKDGKWTPDDWTIVTDGEGATPLAATLAQPAGAVFLDWTTPAADAVDTTVTLWLGGQPALALNRLNPAALKPPGQWNRTVVTLGAAGATAAHNGSPGAPFAAPAEVKALGLGSTGATRFANVFVRPR